MQYFHSLWFLGLIFKFIIVKAHKCFTPNFNEGTCTSILSCDPLLLLVNEANISKANVQFLRDSQCGMLKDGTPKVCCPIPVESTPLLPDIRTCGSSFNDKILLGTKADLGELPWMALVDCPRPIDEEFSCGGVLISKRYVLTAAHCLRTKRCRVRLGECSTKTNPDCYVNKNEKFCAPPVIDVRVEEAIAHEMYSKRDANHQHDIALLRLEREVNYTDYVKPICLPVSTNLRKKNYENQNLLVAGWGKTEKGIPSAALLKLNIPVQSDSSCASLYERKGVQLGRGQICAGGQKNKDSCTGDSGGPLMWRHIDGAKANWFLAGLVSFGPEHCGAKGLPSIYTRISEYVPWIIQHLKP